LPAENHFRQAQASGFLREGLSRALSLAEAHASEALVHGASGGSAARLCRWRAPWAHRLRTAGTQKGSTSQSGRCDQVFDTASRAIRKNLEGTGGRGLDIILEMLANVNLATDLKLLATKGRVIIIGIAVRSRLPADLMSRRASLGASRSGSHSRRRS